MIEELHWRYPFLPGFIKRHFTQLDGLGWVDVLLTSTVDYIKFAMDNSFYEDLI